MLKLNEHKEATEHLAIEQASLPSKAVISLQQHLGRPLDRVLVKIGDVVRRGQLLATSDRGVFAPVHASLSGTVRAVADFPHPTMGSARAVVIESDGRDEPAEGMAPRRDEEVDALAPEELRKIIFEAGVVGLGGAAFPAHIKLAPPVAIRDVILNGAECEPYLTADHRLMLEKPDEIIKGMKLVARMLKCQNFHIAIESNKPDAIEAMRERAKLFNWRVVVLEASYPQGAEKQVIKSCVGREVPSGKLPFDIGVVVHNVATVFAIYEAIYLGKPLYERVLTVSGPCLAHPKNLLARIGVPFRDLGLQCGPFVREVKKVVMGGPMMGFAQYTLDVPVVKGTSGVLFFDEAAEREEEASFCVRCGECVDNCPMGLNPSLISLAIKKDRLDLAEQYGALECVECGLCAYACPTRRGIVQAIRTAKARIKIGQK